MDFLEDLSRRVSHLVPLIAVATSPPLAEPGTVAFTRFGRILLDEALDLASKRLASDRGERFTHTEVLVAEGDRFDFHLLTPTLDISGNERTSYRFQLAPASDHRIIQVADLAAHYTARSALFRRQPTGEPEWLERIAGPLHPSHREMARISPDMLNDDANWQ